MIALYWQVLASVLGSGRANKLRPASTDAVHWLAGWLLAPRPTFTLVAGRSFSTSWAKCAGDAPSPLSAQFPVQRTYH